MARPQDLMALGLPHFLAARVGMNVQLVTCGGGSAASATQIPGRQGIYYVNASNSGSGVKLPLVGGEGVSGGACLADAFTVANIFGATIQIYADNNAAGSVVTFFGVGVSTAGTVGVSLGTGKMTTFFPITVSTWIFDASA